VGKGIKINQKNQRTCLFGAAISMPLSLLVTFGASSELLSVLATYRLKKILKSKGLTLTKSK